MHAARIAVLSAAVFAPQAAQAATVQALDGATLNGATLAWPWALPFAGILLTIALGPLLFARLWH
ncbi:MAG: hypothetical protein ACREC7_16045, partial [Methyloceanibacter sp.]